MGPRRRAAPGKWQYSIGDPPHQLTAYERKDKGLRIYTRLWNGKRYSQKKVLCASIRDEEGRIIPAKEIEAQEKTIRRHRRIVAGLSSDDISSGPLTLAAGFRLLLEPKTGKYATVTRHRKEVARARDVILQTLPRDLYWGELRHAHYRKLWRELAREHTRSGKGGPRQTEVVCGVLQTAARWLQQEEHIEPGDGDPAAGWRGALRSDWEEIVGSSIAPPSRPRHTPEELEKLWRALPKADPRLALGLELGAELRLGQVRRSKRSDIGPSPCGRWAIGTVQVHGRGKKRGELVVLTGDQRRHLTRCLLFGHLADLEAAYQEGEIDDYYLLAGGHLRRKEDHRGREAYRVPVERGDRPLGRTALRRQFRDLEEIAGVEQVPGRVWYGIRRIQADRAEDVEGDARVLNRLGGWTHTATREGYQESGRPEIAEKTRDTRRKIRPTKDLRRTDKEEEK